MKDGRTMIGYTQPRWKALKDWESHLTLQIRQVELLGEIPITADECVQLSKIIGLHVQVDLEHTWPE
jgi:hypothetical protein